MKFQICCIACTLLLVLLVLPQAYGQKYTVVSPDGSLEVNLEISSAITYEVIHNGIPVISPSAISVTLNNGIILGKDAVVVSTEASSIDETIQPLYGKNSEITDRYESLKIDFSENYSLVMRAYDEGMAYRFQTNFGGELIVISEEANFNFSKSPEVIFPEADPAMQSWERAYDTYASLSDIDLSKFSVTPTMFSYEEEGIRILVAESDLFDYPGMYLQRNDQNGMKGKWAHYPKTVSDPEDVYAYHRVLEREDYLARTSGTRNYPWRVVIVTTEDKDLLNNELIYKLAKPQVITNTSWIRPGKTAWEWWHDAILETNQIPSGMNNLGYPLYKVYVDFAAEFKLEYITMDAGWSMDYAAQVCQYAATKGVKVFLWDFINLPITNPERLTQIKNIGAAGIKVDLIERDDQVAINWFEQLAKACAERELMIIFHGSAKPTGLQRTYPNIVNFEAVRGAECAKWDATPNPDYHLQFPFIRMLAGPLDYTPGSMRNVHPSEFTPVPVGIPMTMGTRSHELAMYVLFDQPLGYLCDSPTEYRKNRISMNFLSKVPTVWNETVPLDAKVGEYAIVAKRSGEEWYIGAMTNNTGREVLINFSFLPENRKFTAEIYRDNEKTESDAKALTYETVVVDRQTKMNLKLSSGGGVAMRIHGTITGIGENKKVEKVWVYPNEDHSRLHLHYGGKLKSIRIIDVSGKTFYTQTTASTSHHKSFINIESLTEGVYIVRIETESKLHSLRFVK